MFILLSVFDGLWLSVCHSSWRILSVIDDEAQSVSNLLTFTISNSSIFAEMKDLEGRRAVGPNNSCLSLGQAFQSYLSPSFW